jgi:cobalt-zinc-cadmium efflux system outer membrane protein
LKLAALLLLLASLLATGPVWARAVSVDEAVELALEHNPDFAAVAQELKVAQAELQRANYVSQFNPEIATEAGWRERTGQSNSQDWRVLITQQFEIFGQPKLRRQAARFGYERASESVKNEARLLALAVKMTFFEALRASHEASLLSELAHLDQKLNEAAQARLKAGEISQIDANLARVRFGESQRALLQARERYRLERSSLGRLLGGAAGIEPEPSGELRVEPIRIDPERLLETAKANRPDYKAAQLEISRLKAQAALNRRLALPNPTVGPFVGHENNTEHFVGISVRVPIPLFDRKQAEGTAIAARLTQARARMRALELKLKHEVSDAWHGYQTALEVVKVNQHEVVKPARQSFALLEDAFNAGKLDLLSLSIAERQAFEARMGYIRAWFDLVSAQTSLQLVLGENQ